MVRGAGTLNHARYSPTAVGSISRGTRPLASRAFSSDAKTRPESGSRAADGHDVPPAPIPSAFIFAEAGHATFRAPEKPGAYRVHLRVTDTRKRAATGNFPLLVK